jgi:hypothetical protein
MADDLAREIREAAPEITIIPVLPAGNADLHWNTLIAIADMMQPEALLTCKGTDEFMSDDNWNKTKRLVRSNPEVAVFWVAYRDYFDGQHFKEMQNGPDNHPIIMRGQALHYGVKFHTWPNPQCDVTAIATLPEDIYIEHRRELAGTIRSNMQREAVARPEEIGVQRQFLARLRQAVESRGLEWPEQEQK